jgi:S1-C subfamily serine protease
MLIATFGPTTSWVGKKITREGDFFILENHGPISAQDVMDYDRQGHLVWVSDWMRVGVAEKAVGPRVPRVSDPMSAQSTVAATSMSSRPGGASPLANTQSAPPRRVPSKRLLQSVVVSLIIVGIIAAIFVPRLLGGGKLTPQEIYEKNVGSVVEIQASFASTYNVLGQQTGGGQALGTGFVVSKEGYILTNAHVVSESGQAVKTVIVAFHGSGSHSPTVEGMVVSADESTDVALIKVDPSQTPRLVPISFGDSSKITVGEQVVAIGNPLGFDSSLSLGVVSATDRDLSSPSGDVITGGIQTDAAINPGNSGGPLIDATGHVIGINFQINSQSGGNEGIGFAVPINTAVRVMKQMMKADSPAE